MQLKPLKGILKKKNSQQENSGNNGPNHMREMSYSTMTLPRDILHQCHGQQLHQLEQHQLEQHQLHQQGPHTHHQHHGQFEVTFCHYLYIIFVIYLFRNLKMYFSQKEFLKFHRDFKQKIFEVTFCHMSYFCYRVFLKPSKKGTVVPNFVFLS